MIEPRRRESPSGYHIYNLFQNCGRKFYFRYPLGLVSLHTAPQLIAGAAFHYGKAIWYDTHNLTKACNAAVKEIKTRKAEYEEKDQWERDKFRVDAMLSQWIAQLGVKDFDNYEILHIEQEIGVKLPNGFRFTCIPDLIARNLKDRQSYIFETKTTGFSEWQTLADVTHGDQATALLYCAKRTYTSLKIAGVIPDITYWNKNSIDVSRITDIRGDLVQRDKEQLWQFELGIMSVMADVSRRVLLLKEGEDPIVAFPRNTQWCTSYNRPCEYIEICRRLFSKNRLPKGFKRDEWALKHKLFQTRRNEHGK